MHSVALLVPAYNAAAYFPRLMDCVCQQHPAFSEQICYDDCSSDDTSAVARAHGFHVLRGERNRGPSFARNRLAEAAHSEWIHFHDADDLLDPGYLAAVLALAGHDADVVLCDSSWELEGTRERIIHWTYRQNEYSPDPLAYVVTHPVGVIAALIRRRTFLDAGGFDETKTCWEDADLFVRLAERGARFRCLERTLVTSLRHDRGISHDQAHCDRCRLDFLRGYASRHPPHLRPALAAETEKLIPRFLRHRDAANARAALQFCRELGGDPPSTHHPALRRLKSVLPALWLVRLQAWLRHRPT